MKNKLLFLLMIAALLISCMLPLSSCGSKEAPAAEAPAAAAEAPAAQAPDVAAPAAPAPAQDASPAEDGVSVIGSWVFSWDSAIGSEESLTFTFNEDGTCRMECSNGIGPWEGTYTSDGPNVHVNALDDGNDNPNVVPGMWAKWFVLETGECDLTVSPTGTFTFVEIEGAEVPEFDPSMEPSGEPSA